MKNRNIILLIILIFGVIVMATVTLILIKFPSRKKQLEVENKEKVIIIDESPKIKTIDLNYKISHYSDNDGKIDIEYPVITGYEDKNSENNVNNKLKVNATSILALHELKNNIDSLDINATIKSFSNEKIIVVYEGELLYHTGEAIIDEKINSKSSTPKSSGSRKSSSNNSKNFGYDPNYDTYGGQGNITSNYSGTGDPNYDNYMGQGNTNNFNQGMTPTNNQTSGSPTFFSGNNAGAPISNNSFNNNMYPGANNSITGFAGTKFYEKKIYYTNTVDLTNCDDISLGLYVDIDFLSDLIKKNDKDNIEVITENENGARKYLTALSIDNIKNNLKNADFRNIGLKSWPKCFSYLMGNYIYISFPVSEELNDYVIIKYNYN